MFVEDSNKESETVKPCTSQEASAPGPDYLELLQSAEQMKQYIPDETTRLKAAFGSI